MLCGTDKGNEGAECLGFEQSASTCSHSRTVVKRGMPDNVRIVLWRKTILSLS